MRHNTDMSIEPIDGSTYMTIMTIGLYLVAVLTWQSVAAIAAILAGISTFAYNCYRFYGEYKKNKDNKRE